MAFQQSAESWRAKLHLSNKKTPVLIGVTAIVLVVLLSAGKFLLDAATSQDFTIDRSVGAESQDFVQDSEENGSSMPPFRIHVGGAVVVSGVYEVSPGSRVLDAIQAAGGFEEDAASDALNLAREVTDGEQILVPRASDLASASEEAHKGQGSADTSSSAIPSPNGKVNINQATVADLDTLPGVGASTAQKIISDREANGPFKTIEDLKRVSGIGDKKFASLSDLICVG